MPAPTCLSPLYILREDGETIGPNIDADPSGSRFVGIYGFSDKDAFDRFVAGSERDLRPYPLMKTYLSRRLQEDSEQTQVMVIDAADQTAANVEAVTVQNVLAAMTNHTKQFNSDFRLTFCDSTCSYSLETHPA